MAKITRIVKGIDPEDVRNANIVAATRRGRKTLLNNELRRTIVNYIRSGNYISTACAAVGIHRDTYHEWMKKAAALTEQFNNNPDMQLDEFQEQLLLLYDDVIKAEAEAEIKSLEQVNKAGETQWQAAAWVLERKHEKHWGKKQKLEVEASFSVEEKRQKLRAMIEADDPEVSDALLLLAERSAQLGLEEGDEEGAIDALASPVEGPQEAPDDQEAS